MTEMAFGFWLKKAITAAILPVPLALLLMLTGWALLRWWPKAGKGLLLVGPLYLLLLSFSPISVWLADSLESRYPLYAGQPLDYVLVLGSGHHSDPTRPIEQQLSAVARGRLLEGLRLWRLNPQSTLVVSGYSGMDAVPHARMMQAAAINAGVPAGQILVLASAKDTQEEAQQTAAFVGQQTAALVTSATHMHRSMISYQAAGLTPIAAPADFIATPTHSWYLSSQNLLISQRALHEYIGLLWLQLKGVKG
ncbi:ElyC/SanA/YdcF family protein [uncultured Ferrimonas sp.]|uniref:ElyC/SanA/YdcF family protein n=1 Tax=uncultured Ferrimonas sp. TaxID=432640 RepID=UPI002610006D|nr:ElyC/SanA/YdcF family protein [uncultured Ferrimonas sp.]